MSLNRRGFIAGLIAAPAVLKLGLHMPVKPVIAKVETLIIRPVWYDVLHFNIETGTWTSRWDQLKPR